MLPTAPLRVLSLIPPMTQLNTPYPSTAYITGFLRSRGVDAVQADVALALVLRLFSPRVCKRFTLRLNKHEQTTERVALFMEQFPRYAATITAAINFLQGKDSTLAHRINSRSFLPEGPRFESLEVYVDDEGGDPLAWAFGALGAQDKARHLATLYLNDLADVLKDAIDPRFEFVRYAESLAGSQPTFDPLAEALAQPLTLVDRTLVDIALQDRLRAILPTGQRSAPVVLLSVPFPGSVYAAFRIAQAIKAQQPADHHWCWAAAMSTPSCASWPSRACLTILILSRWTQASALCWPCWSMCKASAVAALGAHLCARGPLLSARARVEAHRKSAWRAGSVQYINLAEPDVPFSDVGTPTWDGLPLAQVPVAAWTCSTPCTACGAMAAGTS